MVAALSCRHRISRSSDCGKHKFGFCIRLSSLIYHVLAFFRRGRLAGSLLDRWLEKCETPGVDARCNTDRQRN
jgi:hypothetical protein